MTKFKAKKFETVYYCGGIGIMGNMVDVMSVTFLHEGKNHSLYAEADPTPFGYYDKNGEWIWTDECGTFEELKQQIIAQAKDLGVSEHMLVF